ncbi:hypothetical protein KKH23_05555 [Patescibacteria group bacterium]|nr:hypothetical protein [Patescibacteria group bacterium]MBU0846637.1 hypothetical protein [Patescibacteria group bacterium]
MTRKEVLNKQAREKYIALRNTAKNDKNKLVVDVIKSKKLTLAEITSDMVLFKETNSDNQTTNVYFNRVEIISKNRNGVEMHVIKTK